MIIHINNNNDDDDNNTNNNKTAQWTPAARATPIVLPCYDTVPYGQFP